MKLVMTAALVLIGMIVVGCGGNTTVDESVPEELRELTAAAMKGDTTAMFELGVAYREGQSTPADIDMAVEWYHKAAMAGHPEAQLHMGFMYEEGMGVEMDEMEAANWYARAAEQGDTLGMINLGGMLSVGRGIPQDWVLAHKWLSLAVVHNAEGAEVGVKRLEDVMSEEQLAAAKLLVEGWTPTPEMP
jgi:TPR repeat protein